MVKKGLKYLLIAITGFLLLIGIFMILTQTSWFRRVVKDKIVEVAGKHINAQLEIGQMDGNIYKNLELKDVFLKDQEGTIATFSSLKLSYKLLALRGRQISIDTIQLSNPSFFLSQKSDSSWNFQQLFPVTSKKPSKKAIPFLFIINAKYVAIQNGTVTTSALIDLIPSSVNNINLLLDGRYSTNNIEAHLKNLSFQTQNPTIKLNEISTYFKLDKSGIAIDSFIIRTTGSNVFINGEFESIEKISTDIESAPLDKQELAVFVPSFKLACSPKIKSFFKSQNDTILAEVELQNGKQTIGIQANLFSFTKATKGEKVKVPYQANVVLNGVIPEDWVEMNKSSNSTVNGEMTLRGTNLFDFKSAVNFNANLSNSVYHGNVLNPLRISGNYENNNIKTEFEMQSARGKAKVKADVLNVSSKLPVYNFTLVADSLNLTSLLPNVTGTFLNASIQAQGEGFTDSTLNINAALDLHNSTIFYIPIDSAKLLAHYKNDQVTLDSLYAKVPGGAVNGSGTFEVSSLYLAAQVDAMLDSLNFLKHYVTLPIDFSSLHSNAQIEGPVSELIYSGDVNINDPRGYSLKIDSLDGTFTGIIKKDSFEVSTTISAENLVTGSTVWDTIAADLSYRQNQIDALVHANWQDTLNANFRTIIQLGDSIHVALPVVELKTFFSDFYLHDSLQTIQLDRNSLNINNLWIKDFNQPDFNLKINGNLGLDQPDNIELMVEKLHLEKFNKIIPLKDSLYGVLSTTVTISGTSESPVLDGNIEIENPGYGSVQTSQFSGQVHYSDKNGKVDFSLPDIGSTGYIQAPMEMFYDSTRFSYTPPETFEAGIKMDSLFLTQSISDMLSNMDVSGRIDLDIKASGTLETPQFYGQLSIKDGLFVNQKYGVSYNDINTVFRLEGDKIICDTLFIKQEKGYLSVNGEVAFDSTIIKGEIANSTLVVDAKNFDVVNNRNFKLKIDANSFLKMGDNSPEFGGNVNVLSSDIYLPALLSDDKNKGDGGDEPLLVQALADPNDTTLINVLEAQIAEEEKSRSEFRKNLTGRMKIIVPRNTWIRSDDMNLELRGDIDLVKTGPFFELFGDIKVNRGHYILYGRKLVMQESQIIFQGGVDFDPTLNILAEYTFRDSNKSKRELKLTVTGLLSDPIINFTLDDNYITESAAVSVLIFGKTPDEMDTGNENGLVGSVGSNMVAQVLTSQLNKTLGATLNLDMIEITATENWQSAAFVVGKYITNDLFITYQRGFGETEGDEITPETLTLEYELNRIFFLHLQSGSAKTSGLDVILKFEQKIEN